MKYFKIIPFIIYYIHSYLNGQVFSNQKVEIDINLKRNTSFDIEEIKVRWKKAALENCTRVPCVVTPPAPSFTCGTSTITDIDNNFYNTVLIGTQCWTKENLKVSSYRNGDIIPIVTDYTGWVNLISSARCWYDNDSTTYEITYGNLYNWYAVSDNRNICPTGWHVPSDDEWTTLTTYLGGEIVAGGKMKSTSNLWGTLNTDATNLSNFSALPGGERTIGGSSFNFRRIRDGAYFWSATEDGVNDARLRALFVNSGNMYRFTGGAKWNGASIRCLKD